MGVLLSRIKDWWQGADRTQRLVSVFGSLFLLALVGFTVHLAGKPKMEPLFAGISPADQGNVVAELQKNGIQVEIGPQGAVLVPTGQIDQARMALAMADKLPSSGPKGSEWLESLNSFSTPAQEREKIKAAKEGDLARSIGLIPGVASALVHINFGKDSPFADEAVEPTAVVNLRETGTDGLDPRAGKAIARLVQMAIPGLKSSNVSVLSSGRLVFDGQEQESSEGLASQKLETENAEAKRREADLQRRLDVAFGPGNTVAMVQLELNMDAVNQDKTERELGDKKVTGEATEVLGDGTSLASPVPSGSDANMPTAPVSAGGPGTSSKTSYTSTQKTMDYPTTETRTSTRKAAGTLQTMTVSVIANSTKIKDAAPVQAILDDYLGSKKGQPGYSASVQSVPFDTAAQDAEKKSAAAAAGQAQIQQLVSILPIAALVFVGFMVAKSIGRIPGRTLTMALPDGGTIRVPASGPALESTASLPERALTSVEELAQSEPELAEALSAMGIHSIDETVDVEAIRQRIDLPLEQIKKMAREKPQAVAMLLKGWLLEDRR